jgi:hypothetical protein
MFPYLLMSEPAELKEQEEPNGELPEVIDQKDLQGDVQDDS